MYKFNLGAKKSSYERGELAKMINDKIDLVDNVSRSNIKEVQGFLHTVHSDFENFLLKHKKDHTNLNLRQLKVTEDVNQALDEIRPMK